MSKLTTEKLAIQVHLSPDRFVSPLHSEIGKPYVETIFCSENRKEVYEFFDSLKSKQHPFVQKIKRSCDYRHYFDARIVKAESLKEITPWTLILERHIDISYRCKISEGTKTGWSKTIYHVPACLISSHSFPNNLNSRDATSLAYTILRSFLKTEDGLLVKISASDEIDFWQEF